MKGKRWILCISLIGLVLMLTACLGETKAEDRNISDSSIRMDVQLEDTGPDRRPIIRTLKQTTYENLNEKEEQKLMEAIAGRVEGDIPCVFLENEEAKLDLKFFNEDQGIHIDQPIKIEIQVPEDPSNMAEYQEEGSEYIKEEVQENENAYSYFLKDYRHHEQEQFLDYYIIRVFFSFDGEDYVSLFGINATNVRDSESFFNEE